MTAPNLTKEDVFWLRVVASSMASEVPSIANARNALRDIAERIEATLTPAPSSGETTEP